MSSLFTVHFLGTSSGLPTKDRNVSCLLLKVGSRCILLDCGEGAQMSLLRGGFNISSIEGIFITHVHGDHCYGLPGLSSTLWLMGRPLPPIVSTKAVLNYVRGVNRLSVGEESQHPMTSVEDFAPDEPVFHRHLKGGYEVSVFARALDHRVLSYGFRVEVRRHHKGSVDAARLKALGIAPGPIYGRIQRGEDVTLEDGTLLKASELAQGPWSEVGSFVYLTDTRACEASVLLAKDADLVSHEATFVTGQEARADDLGHSTALQAVDVWRRSGAKNLVLTHFSARHSESDYRQILESQGLEERVLLAHDGMAVEV